MCQRFRIGFNRPKGFNLIRLCLNRDWEGHAHIVSIKKLPTGPKKHQGMGMKYILSLKFRQKLPTGDYKIKDKNSEKFIDIWLNFETNKRLYLLSLSCCSITP